jgi:hypothetical protein
LKKNKIKDYYYYDCNADGNDDDDDDCGDEQKNYEMNKKIRTVPKIKISKTIKM